jgi:hypothetical protein
MQAALRSCAGLVACVANGKTDGFRYQPAVERLIVNLDDAGVYLRKPACYERIGLPGSGGAEWLKDNWEYVVCITHGGRLPWSDNTAMGQPPKRPRGVKPLHGPRGYQNGDVKNQRCYTSPDIANPGNVNQQTYTAEEVVALLAAQLRQRETYTAAEVAAMLPEASNVIHCKVGGGQIGDKIAHENEAPFPELLAEHFIRSFCPQGGIVCDPFCGSGTTGVVALRWGRRFVGCDKRASQVELTRRRLARMPK